MDHDLVIFDCDGVLVDSELLSCRCLSETLARHGIVASVDAILDQFLGRSVRAVLSHYRRLGRTIPAAFADELASRVRASFTASLRPIPGIETVLCGLRAACCVASSSDRERVAYALSLTGLDGYFGDRLYTAQMVRRGKPAPDLFLHAASAMGVAPARVLVIEDSISGVEAARTAGMTVWGFVGGSHYATRDGRQPLLAAGAERVFDRMEDFHRMGACDGLRR